MRAFDFKPAIELYVQNRAMTAKQLALFYILYNDTSGDMPFLEIARRISSKKNLPGVIGGITSVLAQDIDRIEEFKETNKVSGMTGWNYLFEISGHGADGVHVRMRKEFREVIDQHPKFKAIMQEQLSHILSRYKGKRVSVV